MFFRAFPPPPPQFWDKTIHAKKYFFKIRIQIMPPRPAPSDKEAPHQFGHPVAAPNFPSGLSYFSTRTDDACKNNNWNSKQYLPLQISLPEDTFWCGASALGCLSWTAYWNNSSHFKSFYLKVRLGRALQLWVVFLGQLIETVSPTSDFFTLRYVLVWLFSSELSFLDSFTMGGLGHALTKLYLE